MDLYDLYSALLLVQGPYCQPFNTPTFHITPETDSNWLKSLVTGMFDYLNATYSRIILAAILKWEVVIRWYALQIENNNNNYESYTAHSESIQDPLLYNFYFIFYI